MKKFREIGLMIAFCSMPLLFGTGCGFSDWFQCASCGDDGTRMICFATQKQDNGDEYLSCLGPAACINFGCDSSCFPTECMYVKHVVDENESEVGIVYYYDDGCVGEHESNSSGQYSDSYTCMGMSCTPCSGEKYTEKREGDSVQAFKQNTCFGCANGEEVKEKDRGYNTKWIRQFSKGCFSEAPANDAASSQKALSSQDDTQSSSEIESDESE